MRSIHMVLRKDDVIEEVILANDIDKAMKLLRAMVTLVQIETNDTTIEITPREYSIPARYDEGIH
jgi:D-ribose pyranose/furanose isomerase RbsD